MPKYKCPACSKVYVIKADDWLLDVFEVHKAECPSCGPAQGCSPDYELVLDYITALVQQYSNQLEVAGVEWEYVLAVLSQNQRIADVLVDEARIQLDATEE